LDGGFDPYVPGYRIAFPAVRTDTRFVGSLIDTSSARDLEWQQRASIGGDLYDVAVSLHRIGSFFF
jgi:hypothetical protein